MAGSGASDILKTGKSGIQAMSGDLNKLTQLAASNPLSFIKPTISDDIAGDIGEVMSKHIISGEIQPALADITTGEGFDKLLQDEMNQMITNLPNPVNLGKGGLGK